MSFSPFRIVRSGFAYFWHALDVSRRFAMNLLFLLLLLVIVIAIVAGGAKRLEEKTALVLDFKGQLLEQNVGTARDAFVAGLSGDKQKNVQLRDVLTVLDAAAKDPKIGSVLLMLDDLQGAGLPMLREVAAAIERFKTSGKKVIAWGSSYNQRQYLLAAHANEVLLHPMGMVLIDGFGGHRSYYRDALDKLGITVNVMRVGTYKSFAEPFIANGPSPAATEAESFMYNAMWSIYTDDIEKSRKLPAGSVMRLIDNLPQLLTAENGDVAKLSLSSKLVDGLKTRDELRQLMIERGAKDPETKSFRQVSFDDYLMGQKPKLLGDAIGVVIASGEISEGIAPAGKIGGLSTANLIRKAREDDKIKAIVLRVDSPGGSAFGSELIRRELELTRKAGKPVVVSMGNVAASGGYWISMAADEVMADAATVTGSIGVFAIFPTADKVIDKLGIHTAGTTTTWLRDATNPLRPMDPRFGQLIQTGVEHIYRDFTVKAALARKTTPEKIDEVAQGRVWTGTQAKERGLIDTVGSYTDALKSAAKRAKLGNDYRVSYIEPDLSKFERFFDMFGETASRALNERLKASLGLVALPPAAARDMVSELTWLADLTEGNRPFMALTHCLCQQP